MKFNYILLGCLLMVSKIQAKEQLSHHQELAKINHFHMVTNQLASAAAPELHQFQAIKDAGFNHIVVLGTGLHVVEQSHAEALGMSYDQVSVSLTEPSEDLFFAFSALLDSYGEDQVFVYSEQNWRAATYVYRYQNLQTAARLLAAK